MSAADYHALPGVSNSGLTDFLDSPLYYWHQHVSPERPKDEPTSAMQVGSAVHCAVLEPSEFDKRYCAKFDAPEGCLVTTNDLRRHMESLGLRAKGTLKADIIEQVRQADPSAKIYDLMAEQHDADNAGKIQFGAEAWRDILGCAKALRNEPELVSILSDPTGQAERKFTVKHNGLMLRSMMDWTTDSVTLDLKTFSRRRGEPIDKTITKAIWYEGYHRQAYLYSLVRSIAAGDEPPSAANAPEFIFAFVESSAPYETRIRRMKPGAKIGANLLWLTAEFQVQQALKSYGEYVREFGEKEWRHAQRIENLADEEFPQVAY